MDVSQHIFCNLAGPGTMQEESAFEVLHLNEIILILRVSGSQAHTLLRITKRA